MQVAETSPPKRAQRAEGRRTAAEIAASGPAHRVDRPPLTEVEREVIDLFVQISSLLGQSRLLGEIYGLLFISSKPLVMDDFIGRLGMSKGGASMGLRHLQSLGAVRMVYVPGDRRIHFEAVAELRVLVTRFLNEQVLPHLDSGLNRLEKIQTMVKQLPAKERDPVQARVTMLQSWEKKTRSILPVVIKLLSLGK